MLCLKGKMATADFNLFGPIFWSRHLRWSIFWKITFPWFLLLNFGIWCGFIFSGLHQQKQQWWAILMGSWWIQDVMSNSALTSITHPPRQETVWRQPQPQTSCLIKIKCIREDFTEKKDICDATGLTLLLLTFVNHSCNAIQHYLT